MRRILAICALILCAGSAPAFSGTHSFQTGKLLEVTTDQRLVDGTSYSHAIFVVQIGDIVYTLRGERVSARTKDYAQGLIVGDSVQVSIEGEHVFLLKPNGKDLKASILKRERAKAN